MFKGVYNDLRVMAYDLRYLDTGSALRVFIWSKNLWKSNEPSLGLGDEGPLPVRLGVDVPELGRFPVSLGASCCAAKEAAVVGEGIALTGASVDTGRGLTSGMANDLAKAASEGKEEGDAIGTADCDAERALGVVSSVGAGDDGSESL